VLLFNKDRDSFICHPALHQKKKKPLLVLQAIKRGRSIDINHPTLHFQLIRFFLNIDSMSLRPVTKQVIDLERGLLLGTSSSSSSSSSSSLSELTNLNENFLKANKTSLPHRLAVARVVMLLGGEKGRQRVIELVSPLTVTSTRAISDCEDVYDFLLNELKEKQIASRYQKECAATFPLTPSFKQEEHEDGKQENEDDV